MLWYVIGTTIVPGLLFPLVTGYFPQWKAPARFAFASMLGGWLTSLVWLVVGWSQELGNASFYPWGIEPMVPGLAVSGILWWIGWLRGREKRLIDPRTV